MEEEETNEEWTSGAGTELLLDNNSFRPLYLLSEWVEPSSMLKRVTVSIILPTGVEAQCFKVRATDSGRVLKRSVQWPEAL